MLHHSQAMSLDDIYLEDIPHIIHPDTAAGDLAETALPNRIIQEWNLPQGYTRFVSRYQPFHWQHPWMAYRDTLADIKSGKLVLLRKDITGHAISGVLTTSGDLRNDLPLFLHTRLSHLLSRQLKRPGYHVRPAAMRQRVTIRLWTIKGWLLLALLLLRVLALADWGRRVSLTISMFWEKSRVNTR